MVDRITRIEIDGLRTLHGVRLDLKPLTVVIGENGSGKSTLIEAFELVRRLGSSSFIDDLHRIHGGVASLLRFGEQTVRIGIGTRTARYVVELEVVGQFLGIAKESLVVHHNGQDVHLISRNRSVVDAIGGDGAPFRSEHEGRDPFLSRFFTGGSGWATQAGINMLQVIRQIDVQLPFFTTPSWYAKSQKMQTPMREPLPFEPAESLASGGLNLGNAFQQLKNAFGGDAWQETLELIRLGMGDEVDDVSILQVPGGGYVSFGLKLQGSDQTVPSFSLSDGQLSYLGFVALTRLKPPGGRSLLAFDEPELHLHPRMLLRVVGFFERLSEETTVVLSTHSDRLLDMLRDPSGVVLAELDQRRATRFLNFDGDQGPKWVDAYGGLGGVRASGHTRSAFQVSDEA